MELALIPPVNHIGATRYTKYQLMLPHLLRNERYMRAYAKRRLEGSYIILDNGAADEGLISKGSLLELAQFAMVHEVVIPDTIGDTDATLEQMAKFFSTNTPEIFNYMGVVQGRVYNDLLACATEMMDAFGGRLQTLAVPRHVLLWNQNTRVQFVNDLRHDIGWKKDIHLLGMHPDHPLELEYYGNQYRELDVRGIDTSAPFCQALAGQMILDGKPAKRPQYYFESMIDPEKTSLGWLNISIMKQWVHGDLP